MSWNNFQEFQEGLISLMEILKSDMSSHFTVCIKKQQNSWGHCPNL